MTAYDLRHTTINSAGITLSGGNMEITQGDKLILLGATNEYQIYSDGTNIAITKGGAIHAYITASYIGIGSGTSGQLKSTGVATGSGSPQLYSSSTTAAWQILTAVTSAADRIGIRSDTSNALTHDGSFIHVFRSAGVDYSGITKDGAFAVWFTNKSGGALVAGDVVVVDATADRGMTTTTSAGDITRLGVVYTSTIADDARGAVVVSGPVKTSVSGTVAYGDLIETHTTAGEGITNNSAAAYAAIGRALSADSGGFATINVGA